MAMPKCYDCGAEATHNVVQVNSNDSTKVFDHDFCAACAKVQGGGSITPLEDTPHVGHYSRLGGTYWCDTCNSPYCELA